ncbi:MAG TPA: Fur family transcriptional regulator [Roseiflexaceae bacterium]|jgi:Fur family transcriptional regulator, ferric uptake regulator
MKPSNDADTLHRQRHRLTPQRLIVLEMIKRSGKHLTAQEIHAAVLPQQPYVNIATVYRTLQWLQDVGLVAPIAVGSGAVRYEYTSGAVHHHLICQECGQEQEIGDDILDALKARLLERYGFTAQWSHLALPGRCAACRREAREEGANP